MAFFVLAIWVLHDAFRQYRPGEFIAALDALPGTAVALALACTAATYLAATVFDLFAFRHVAHQLPLD